MRSPSSNLFNAEAGFQLSRIWRVKVDLLNLFDSKSSDIDYFYTSGSRVSHSGAWTGSISIRSSRSPSESRCWRASDDGQAPALRGTDLAV